jgi:hypothetical protein
MRACIRVVGRTGVSVIRRAAGYAANLVKTILAANPPYGSIERSLAVLTVVRVLLDVMTVSLATLKPPGTREHLRIAYGRLE